MITKFASAILGNLLAILGKQLENLAFVLHTEVTPANLHSCRSTCVRTHMHVYKASTTHRVLIIYSCHQLPVGFLYRKLSYNVHLIIYAPRFLAELLSTKTLVLSILSLTSAPKPAPWKVLCCILSVLCSSFC